MKKFKESGKALGIDLLHFFVGTSFFLGGIFGTAGALAADVNLKREADEIVITAAVQKDFEGTDATISAPEAGTVEIHVPGADFGIDGRRQLFRFDDMAVKTVSLTKDSAAGIIRFNLKENNASTAADQISIGRANGIVRVSMPAKLQPVQAPLTGVKSVIISAVPNVAATQTNSGPSGEKEPAEIQNRLTAREENKSSEGDIPATEAAKENVVAPAKDTRPESEIPVFTSAAQEKKTAGTGIERLVFTLFVVCVVLGAVLFGIKRWSANRKDQASSPTKIRILTQHHLGPKKSLAIIQVAGEAILIGITDQNISMLKTLSLIDDEVPGMVPKNFSDELASEDSGLRAAQEGYDPEPEDQSDDQIENFAMKGLGEVRDLVNTKFSIGSNGRSSRKDV
jgi:flagellar protein FliO/FliZ